MSICGGLPRATTKASGKSRYKGFDYYNTRTGTIESGDTSKIAMWLLDTDYDGRSLYPRQVFFPMADDRRRLGAAGQEPESGDRPRFDRSISRDDLVAF